MTRSTKFASRALAALVVLAAASLRFAPQGAAAPELPTPLSTPDALGYVKIAPLNVILQKLEAYGQIVAPDAVKPGELTALLKQDFDVADMETLDLNKGWSFFAHVQASNPSVMPMVGYLPINPGSGAALATVKGVKVKGDHILAFLDGATYTPALEAALEANESQYGAINDAAPQSDVRIWINVDSMAPLLSKWTDGVAALAMGQGEKIKEASGKIKDLGILSADLQMVKQGAELQVNAFPKAGTALAKLCSQEDAKEFTAAAILSGDGAVRAIWQVVNPADAEAFEADGAQEMIFPGAPMTAALKVRKYKEEKAARAAIEKELRQTATAMGGQYEQIFKPAARNVAGVAIDEFDLAAAMAAMMSKTNPMAAGFASKVVAKAEIAYVNGFCITASGPGIIDAAIARAQKPGPAKPLAAQGVYPGQYHFYADIDVVKYAKSITAMLPFGAMAQSAPVASAPAAPGLPGAPAAPGARGQAAPGAPAPRPAPGMPGAPAMPGGATPAPETLPASEPEAASAPPIAIAASLSGGAAQLRLFFPLSTAKTLYESVIKQMAPALGGFMAQSEQSAKGPKMPRAQADMRMLATAIEAYAVDNNVYPASTTDAAQSIWGKLPDGKPVPTFRTMAPSHNPYTLTTPISYITRLPEDPFAAKPGMTYGYYSPPGGKGWILFSPGPNGTFDFNWSEYNPLDPRAEITLRGKYQYDPTNGATGGGDLMRFMQSAPAPAPGAHPMAGNPMVPAPKPPAK